uniref:Epidermal growth factor receptor substrate 15-like 1 n=1 Tax=Arcella intermedia TaxID=1963864 RepID=A0A6B2L1M4_9EUKA
MLFKRSGLSNDVLASIWGVVSPSNTPLSLNQFVVACRLIALAQNGRSPTMQELSVNPQIPLANFNGITAPLGQPTPAVMDQGRKDFNWTISPSLYADYVQKFNSLDTDRDGFIPGNEAASFLSLSELPSKTLARVWELSDINKDGKLDLQEHCVAMYLVSAVKAGLQLPSPLPQSLLSSIWACKTQTSSTPQGSPYALTQPEISQWSQVFEASDIERLGIIHAHKAKEILVKSGLSNTELALIYGLSDLDGDGNLNRMEFIIAMKLIKIRSSGMQLPNELPAELKNSLNLTPHSSTAGSPTPTVLSSNNPASFPRSSTPSTTKPEDSNQLAALETKIKELTLQITSLTNQKNQFESSWKKLSKEKRDADAEIRDLQAKLSKANDKVSEIEGKLIQAEARLSVLASRGTDSSHSIQSDLNAQLEAKDRELAYLREQNSELERMLQQNKRYEAEEPLDRGLPLPIPAPPPPRSTESHLPVSAEGSNPFLLGMNLPDTSNEAMFDSFVLNDDKPNSTNK